MRFASAILCLCACTRPAFPTAGDGGQPIMTPGADLALPPGADLALPPGADLALPPGADLALPPDLATAHSGGTVPVGEACAISAGGDNCVAGSTCLARRDPNNGGVCYRGCISDADCPKGAVGNTSNVSHCLQSPANPSIKTCTIPCNPVIQAGASQCAAGLFCDYESVTTEYTNCADDPGMTTTSLFQECDANGECDPGYYCDDSVPALGTYCFAWCRVGHDEDCTNPNYPYCGGSGAVPTTMFAVCNK